MPDTELRCNAGVLFGPDGLLYVAGGYDVGGSFLDTKLATFDPANGYQLIGLMDLDNWRHPGSIAIGIPEPATLALLCLGWLVLPGRRPPRGDLPDHHRHGTLS